MLTCPQCGSENVSFVSECPVGQNDSVCQSGGCNHAWDSRAPEAEAEFDEEVELSPAAALREKIMAASVPGYEELNVPGWGFPVWLRPMSGPQRDAVDANKLAHRAVFATVSAAVGAEKERRDAGMSENDSAEITTQSLTPAALLFLREHERLVISLSLCDPEGTCLFDDPDDLGWLAEADYKFILENVSRVNGLTKKDIEGHAEN